MILILLVVKLCSTTVQEGLCLFDKVAATVITWCFPLTQPQWPCLTRYLHLVWRAKGLEEKNQTFQVVSTIQKKCGAGQAPKSSWHWPSRREEGEAGAPCQAWRPLWAPCTHSPRPAPFPAPSLRAPSPVLVCRGGWGGRRWEDGLPRNSTATWYRVHWTTANQTV